MWDHHCPRGCKLRLQLTVIASGTEGPLLATTSNSGAWERNYSVVSSGVMNGEDNAYRGGRRGKGSKRRRYFYLLSSKPEIRPRPTHQVADCVLTTRHADGGSIIRTSSTVSTSTRNASAASTTRRRSPRALAGGECLLWPGKLNPFLVYITWSSNICGWWVVNIQVDHNHCQPRSISADTILSQDPSSPVRCRLAPARHIRKH